MNTMVLRTIAFPEWNSTQTVCIALQNGKTNFRWCTASASGSHDMIIRLKKLVSWFYPVQLERTKGELEHDLEVNIHNGKIMLDAGTVNYSYGSLQEIFDYAFTQTGLYDEPIHTALIPGFGSGSVATLLHDKCDPEMEIIGIEADRE